MLEEKLILYLKKYKKEKGIYIITPRNNTILKKICKNLSFEYTSNIAYIGKGNLTKSSDLYRRARQEMGWSNFRGATFVRKIGLYLELNIKDKSNLKLKEITKKFILNNFNIKCIVLKESTDILEIEKNMIKKLHPCLNVKHK